MPGFVYFATNPVMPGLTKIGFTESVLSDRFADLQGTGVPVPFELFAAIQTEDSRACEQAVHGALRDVRVAENREFFRIEAKAAVKRVLPLLLGHAVASPVAGPIPVGLYGDLDKQEFRFLAAFATDIDPRRPNDWGWAKWKFGMDELDGRHYFHVLHQKGYLRVEKGYRGAIQYDLAPRGVSFGRALRNGELNEEPS